jgi:hypothetical protein
MKSKTFGCACASIAAGWTVLVAGGALAATVKIQEGTDFPVRFDEKLSSKTNTEGDRFTISLADEVRLPGGAVIPAGYKGVGEVTEAEKNGMLGKAGTLNVRFNYVKIGDVRVRLRGSKGREGKGSVGAVVVLAVLFGPLGLLVKGHNVEVKQGQIMTAFVDEDTEIVVPLAAPPKDVS